MDALLWIALPLGLAPSERAVLSIWGFGGGKAPKLEAAAARFAEISAAPSAATAPRRTCSGG